MNIKKICTVDFFLTFPPGRTSILLADAGAEFVSPACTFSMQPNPFFRLATSVPKGKKDEGQESSKTKKKGKKFDRSTALKKKGWKGDNLIWEVLIGRQGQGNIHDASTAKKTGR